MMRALALLLLWSTGGCAIAARNARVDLDQARLARAREVSIEQRAPVAYQRFREAQKRAQRSPKESAARGDYEALARLRLETAIAEAERQLASAARLAEEEKLASLDSALTESARERERYAKAAELAAAQTIAQVEAERALARAALKPQQRVKLPREQVQRAGEALLERAELIALVLAASEVDSREEKAVSPALAELRAKLSEAKTLLAKEPDVGLARADRALFRALALLGALRAGAGQPDALEKASLHEALASAGARATRTDRGLTGVIDAAFSGNALTASAARTLERLCALTKAHPHGPVQLVAEGKSEPIAQARASALRASLRVSGCEGERFSVVPLKRGDQLEASWLAY
jgi:hypothetical protein